MHLRAGSYCWVSYVRYHWVPTFHKALLRIYALVIPKHIHVVSCCSWKYGLRVKMRQATLLFFFLQETSRKITRNDCVGNRTFGTLAEFFLSV